MAQAIWVTIDGGERMHVKTDIQGRCSNRVGQVFEARVIDWMSNSRLAEGKNTPRMRLEIVRVEHLGGPCARNMTYHCKRLDQPATEHRQEELF